MSTAAQDDSVHRLLDIVVEEVSLVDRAANLRRFLIVKRSDQMEETTDQAQSQGAGADGAAKLTPEDDGEVAGNTDGEGTSNSMVEAAVEALERLTETVETLGSLAEGDARERVGEIATELRALSERLVEAAGVTPAEPQVNEGGLGMVLESVRATLQHVGSLIDASKAAKTKPKKATPAPDDEDAAASKTAKGTTPPRPQDDPLPGHLHRLAEAVSKLAHGMRDQSQRLAKLEKSFGLPHSTPAREQGNRPVEDVGWPMDLNRPFDRENVDKAISFHDL